eukprot:TRINITY_DN4487_c0_g1_i1.p1 TRINITY_DN4487_c0_g1~~TRINITY_DN4487_c0_g1_i1.p1  ORF type:complete len:392 (+),score=25.20 TRINITY_DN4487_c0_g1_i1:110-1285(+)
MTSKASSKPKGKGEESPQKGSQKKSKMTTLTGWQIFFQVVIVNVSVGAVLYGIWHFNCGDIQDDCVDVTVGDTMSMNLTEYREKYPFPFFHKIHPVFGHKNRCPATFFSPSALKTIGASILLAVMLTLGRFIITKQILWRIAAYFEMLKADYQLFSESCMQILFYAAGWTLTAVYVFQADFFYDTALLFEGNIPNAPMSPHVWYIYVYNIGLYMHFMYALFSGIDSSKDDVVVLWSHHILTMTLLYFSLVMGMWRMGVLVLFTHDICDVFLHTVKIWSYFDHTGKYDWFEKFVVILFIPLPLSWLIFRLGLFPLKVIYPSVFQVVDLALEQSPEVPSSILNPPDYCIYYFFNPLLVILLALQLFWFYLIIRVALKKLREESWEDVRDKKDQ